MRRIEVPSSEEGYWEYITLRRERSDQSPSIEAGIYV